MGPNDVVLHLGDLALGPIESSVALTSRLNGRRLLVPGNHDRVSPATQSNRAIERFRPLYEDAGWTVPPEILRGARRGVGVLASHYPYMGDMTGVERHSTHRPVDEGIPLLHGHTHSREHGPHGSHEFHVGVDAFDFAPVQFELIDAWMDDLRRKDADLASESRAETALEIVGRAQSGELSRGDLIAALLAWNFDPSYRTRGLADDWELRSNSCDAVVHAYAIGLIDEKDFDRISRHPDERGSR